MRGPLIGRTAELDRIHAVDAAEGPAAVVLVGDPGSGKSRLLIETAAETDRRVFRVVGYEPERLVPLAAASALLRELGVEEAFGSDAEPLRVFEATHRALAARGRVLLVVDDVQWIDDLSRALVHYVARAAVSARADLHVAAAGRAAAPTFALADDLSRLFSPGAVELIEIGAFGVEDGVRLAHSVDPTLDEPAATAIWQRSGGLPFWIDALVRARAEPLEAGRLLTGRLRDAGGDAAQLLGLLAVVARPIADDAVALLLDWPAARAEAVAEELVARGVATRARGSVALAHDLLREAAYAELSDERRRQLHARVSSWLAGVGGDELPLLREALEHRVAAGGDRLELALRLASLPQRGRLGRDGFAVLAAIADAADGAGAAELRERVAELAAEVGEHASAVERWCAFAATCADTERSAGALLRASKAAFELGPALPGRARTLLDAAAAHARSDELLVRLRAHEARVLLWLEHRTAAGAAVAREAVERGEQLRGGAGARRAVSEALRAAYEAAMQEDRGEEMLGLAERLLAESDGDEARAEALIARGLAQRFARPLPDALASFREAAELAVRRVLPRQAVDAAFWLVQCLHDGGGVREAERAAAELQELADRVGDVSRVRAHVRRVADQLSLVNGRPAEGLAGLAAEAESEPDPHYRIGSRETAALFLARAAGPHDADEIATLLELARRDAVESGCPRCSNELQLVTVEALARTGRADDAAAELERVEPGVSADPLPALWRLRAQALLAVARESDEAVPLLEAACAAAAALGRGLDELWLRIDLGRALAAADRPAAAAQLRAAAARADERGAATVREIAERELRKLGVRTWRRGRSRVDDGSLSEREQEVADLVARGASNPEIAQALFLSRKTVERHVSNVLAKRGVRNRAELAALLARESEGAPR